MPLPAHLVPSAGIAIAAIAIAILATSCRRPSYPAGSDEAAAAALARRTLGSRARDVRFATVPSPTEGQDFYRIEASDGKILVSGNNANSMAAGLGHYLRYECGCNLGWFVWDKVDLPKKLPLPAKPVEITSRVPQRFFLNYCTYGYTMPWWHWDEWEHFIDWMALTGINLPLAITGQESIWYEVWTSLGLPEDKVRAYFTGPAHLPWHRMLNIDRWGGPLPQSWLSEQAQMQKKIVARERELGMRPVLPAFSGHVPDFLWEIYPDAKISKMGSWCGFPDEDVPSFLDPMDPLFPKIQKLFLDKEREIYGTDHVYGIDLFNEMEPPSGDPGYLGRVSRQVYESLAAADPEGVWLQMTWLFWNERTFWTNDRVEPFITSYPKEKSILLDYYCERQEVWRRTEKYFGVPYIWCYLGNFGGNTYLAGDFAEIDRRIEGTFAEGGGNLLGIGSTLEGFDCNPYVYQFVFDKAWDFPAHRDLDTYADFLSDTRTGVVSDKARGAWRRLVRDIYIDRSVPGHSPLLNLRPSLGRSTSYHSSVRHTYGNNELRDILSDLYEAGGHGSAYEFDMVNLTRQYLSNIFEEKLDDYKQAYKDRRLQDMTYLQLEMGYILSHLEDILSTQTCFLLGKWIGDARGWGTTPEEADYYESNARDLLSSWGDGGNLLTDYANRTWSGLVSSYYKVRWDMFFEAVGNAVADHGEFTAEDEADLRRRTLDFEKSWWTTRPDKFPSEPKPGAMEAVGRALRTYGAAQ